MPDASRLIGSYPAQPAPDDPRIAEPLARGQPEEIVGLSWTRPDFISGEHRIVRKFDVDSRKRRFERVPCAICSGGHPKFYSGAILWSDDGHLRIIGHECARNEANFGAAKYDALIRQREQRDLDDAALEWLSTNIAALPELRTFIQGLRPATEFIEAQSRSLFRSMPELANALHASATRHGGELSVVQGVSELQRMVTGENNRGRSNFETVVLGKLEGRAFLIRPSGRKSRMAQLDQMTSSCALVPPGPPVHALDILIDDGEARVNAVAGTMLRTVQRALRLSQELREASLFLSPGNIAALEHWGADPRNNFRFQIRRFPAVLEVVMADRSRCKLSMAFPGIPDTWPWEAIDAAGVQLSQAMRKSEARQQLAAARV